MATVAGRRRSEESAASYSPQEVAALAEVATRAVQKGIDEGVVPARVERLRGGGRQRRRLDEAAVYAFAAFRHAGFPLPAAQKRRVYERLARCDRRELAAARIELSATVTLDARSFMPRFLERVAAYERARRDGVIVRDPEILGGTPVIRGTRVTAYAVEGRLRDGEAVDDILADYPELRPEDVEAAALYARANPLVGRPGGRPWRRGP